MDPRERRAAAAQTKLTRGHSCIACYNRKVKCDGKRPCTTCVKTSRGAECRSARPLRAELLLRLKRYENLLVANGIPLDAPAGEEGEMTMLDECDEPDSENDDGHVIMQGGHPRFVQNLIWSRLGGEFADDLSVDPSEPSEYGVGIDGLTSTPDSLLLGKASPHHAVAELLPSVPQMLRLWQIFLENFNPLVKLLHYPSAQQTISAAISDYTRLDASTEALVSSISLCAVTTLSDQECLDQIGEARSTLLARYSEATQQSLANAQFLKSTDIVVLQSLTLYLLAVRQTINEQALWLLTGVASRLAQMMGVHREHSLSRLPPFEAEIRRRLWRQIIILDSRSAQISGATGDGGGFNEWGDARRPLNVNDSDLSPFMRNLPFEYEGPTEMLFCTVRSEVGDCMRQLRNVGRSKPNSNNNNPGGGAAAVVAQKEQLIEAFEAKLENMLRRCDDSIPLHLMSTFLGRSAVCQMRFSVLQAKQGGRNFRDMSTEDGGALFELALRILEYDTRTYRTPCLRQYLWHVGNSFPFPALIHVLNCLLYRTGGGEEEGRAGEAWTSVDQAYGNHPELIADADKSPLFAALGNLTLKAWEQRGPGHAVVPPAVATLQENRLRRTQHAVAGGSGSTGELDGMAALQGGSDEMMPHLINGVDTGGIRDLSALPLWMPGNIDWGSMPSLEI
ncbi:C6 transcription factor domain-containing protein [Coniochaeta sp. 2T2.1]|nr:C6 transcription factor domain-containing protein [Coniochaeta sp. 2T2.1]